MARPKGPPSVLRTIRIPIKIHEKMKKQNISLTAFVRSKLDEFFNDSLAQFSVIYRDWVEMRKGRRHDHKFDIDWLMSRYGMGNAQAATVLFQLREIYDFTFQLGKQATIDKFARKARRGGRR